MEWAEWISKLLFHRIKKRAFCARFFLAAIIVGKVLENNADTYGYNTATGEFGDLIAFKNC